MIKKRLQPAILFIKDSNHIFAYLAEIAQLYFLLLIKTMLILFGMVYVLASKNTNEK